MHRQDWSQPQHPPQSYPPPSARTGQPGWSPVAWGPAPSAPPPSTEEDREIARLLAEAKRKRSMMTALGLVLGGVAVVGVIGYVVVTSGAAASVKDLMTRSARDGALARKNEEAAQEKMAAVPAGTFKMGDDGGYEDERPAHEVRVEAFSLDVHEVTVAAFEKCVNAGSCAPPLAGQYCVWKDRLEKGDRPVNCVNFHQAEAFCKWRNARLPTEAEWEYAARGTANNEFPWGNQPPWAKVGNFADASYRRALPSRQVDVMFEEDDGFAELAPVGSYSPAGDSSFGIQDMAGNVWEWTASPFCRYGDGRCTDSERVLKGGGFWNGNYANVRSSTRWHEDSRSVTAVMGFRCAR